MAAGPRRRRLLPAWMGAAGDERAAAVPAKARRRREAAAAGPRAAAAVVYCMNEAELVDEALAILAENLQHQEGKKVRSGSEMEQELQATPEEVPGSTASERQDSERSPAHPSAPGTGAAANAERTGWEDSEDDVLKYVREIFFS